MPRGYSDTYEKEYRRKNGTLLPVEIRTHLITDAHGQPAGTWAIMRDITARKRAEDARRQAHEELEQRVQERTAELQAANQHLRREIEQRQRVEEALRQNEAKYRALVESCPDAVVLLDLAGQVLFASQRAADQHHVRDFRDLVLFYTDGLEEVHHEGGPLFGLERILRVVRAHRDRTAAEIIEALHQAALHYAAPEKPHDDITLVVVKVR